MGELDDRKYTLDMKHGGSCDKCGNRIQIIQVVKSNHSNVNEILQICCPDCGVTVHLFLTTSHVKVN